VQRSNRGYGRTTRVWSRSGFPVFTATASGSRSTVAGGDGNTAGGYNSFAAGAAANAKDDYSFVWCGNSGNLCDSAGTNSFVVVTTGGPIYFFDGPGGEGCSLTPGTAGWQCSSDRNLKKDIRSIDSVSVLERVAHIPISHRS
jgi:hypothetical protein